MGHKEKDSRSKNVASSTNARSVVVCYECGERGHKSNACPKRADRQGGNVRGQAYVVRDAEHNQGPNVVTRLSFTRILNQQIKYTSTMSNYPTESELGTFRCNNLEILLVGRTMPSSCCGKKEVHCALQETSH
ncbi:putative reverse transcriptase domain-containing protein [Tanacetum coccineum]